MAGNKCVYLDCGFTRRSVEGLRMFRFPVKDETRCREWILNCGKLSCHFVKDSVFFYLT